MNLLDLFKKLRKKGLEAPSTLMVMIIFIVGLAIVILLVLFFSGRAGGSSSGFTNITKWSDIFRW
jgi:cytochrome c biogenesis protein CcdA